MNPFLSVVCDEKSGPIERHVYPVIFTPENLNLFYERASKFPVLFGREIRGPEDFFRRFFYIDGAGLPVLHGPIWQVDDFVGVFYLTDIYEFEATAHFAFFDARFFGRHKLVRAMLEKVFRSYGFLRLNVEIPTYSGKKVFQFVSDLGFALEGRKRKCAPYKGALFDINLYGILRDEVVKDGS